MLWTLLFILLIAPESAVTDSSETESQQSNDASDAPESAVTALPGPDSIADPHSQQSNDASAAPGTPSSCGSSSESCCKCEDLLNSQKSALNGTTSQSSNYTDHHSGRALDRNMSTCAHSIQSRNSWWTIDLLGVYTISNIIIYNTNVQYTNITGAQIFIGNSRKNNGTTNKICANITNFEKDVCNNFTCPQHTSGRYITVLRKENKHVILCEVRINGKQKESPFQLIQESKTWEEALDYCRGRHMDLASILDEEKQAFAELKARNATTPYVWLGLRYTCTLSFWFWVADHRLEFSNWATGGKKEDCYMSAAMSKTEDHQWFSKPDHSKFNFICEK